MAEAIRYVCNACGRVITAWSDGNPYYIDGEGRKQYAYHPDHERLARCIGNDSPNLCLSCGKEFNVDSRAPTANCPGCRADDIAVTHHLDGRHCPFCKEGVFAIDPKFRRIS